MHCDRSQKTVIANGWHRWLGQTKTQDYSTLNHSCTAFFFWNTITLRNFSNSASILMSWSNADANCSYVHCLQSTGTKHSQRASTYCWETCGQTNEIFNKEYASCEFNYSYLSSTSQNLVVTQLAPSLGFSLFLLFIFKQKCIISLTCPKLNLAAHVQNIHFCV